MTNTNNFKIGDIVRIVPKWLNENENPEEDYIIIEILGQSRGDDDRNITIRNLIKKSYRTFFDIENVTEKMIYKANKVFDKKQFLQIWEVIIQDNIKNEHIDYINKLSDIFIENLPFENKKEKEKYIDLFTSFKFFEDIEKLTMKIINRLKG